MNHLIAASPYLLWAGIVIAVAAIARAFYLSRKADYFDPHH
jgi:inner membrane protein involved in colicin E2 resistance